MHETTIEKPDAWIVNTRQDRQARCRLFCFPYAGGGSSIYRPWLAHMTPHIHLCPVELPGHEKRLREPAYDDVSALVKTLADILPPYLDLPFAFFGHCIGALIAFELARELSARKKPPRHLIVSGFRSPDLRNPNRVLHNLPDADFMHELRRYGGTSEILLQDQTVMNRLLPSFRADFALHERYEYQAGPKLECPLSVFGGAEDALVKSDHLTGWAAKTSGETSIRMFPGGHFFLINQRAQVLGAVTDALGHVIDR
jgi:medium-chain acyl-[acyl-carrier-protein] hydrolase